MNEQTRREALQHSRHALDLIEKRELTREEQDAVVADCVRNFAEYVNPGILDYRKSVSTDYTAVEWSDDGSTFKDICLLYTSPSPRDRQKSRMPSSA